MTAMDDWPHLAEKSADYRLTLRRSAQLPAFAKLMIPMKLTVSTCHPTAMIPMDDEFQIGSVGVIIRDRGLA